MGGAYKHWGEGPGDTERGVWGRSPEAQREEPVGKRGVVYWQEGRGLDKGEGPRGRGLEAGTEGWREDGLVPH